VLHITIQLLQCVAVCCSALQCVAVYCSVLCSVLNVMPLLQCVAGCCSVLQCVVPLPVHQRGLKDSSISSNSIFGFNINTIDYRRRYSYATCAFPPKDCMTLQHTEYVIVYSTVCCSVLQSLICMPTAYNPPKDCHTLQHTE